MLRIKCGYGIVNGVAAAYLIMVKQGSGHIVNTASAAGLIPAVGEISYTTSKYGVVGLSNALRVEGADLGVKVSVVCPQKTKRLSGVLFSKSAMSFKLDKSNYSFDISSNKCKISCYETG